MVAQCFLGALGCSASFGFGSFAGSGNNAGSFSAGFVDQLTGLLFGTDTQFGRGFTRLAQFFRRTLFGECEIGLRFVCCRKPVSDLLRTFVDGLHQRWPHEFHRDPREDEEHNDLCP